MCVASTRGRHCPWSRGGFASCCASPLPPPTPALLLFQRKASSSHLPTFYATAPFVFLGRCFNPEIRRPQVTQAGSPHLVTCAHPLGRLLQQEFQVLSSACLSDPSDLQLQVITTCRFYKSQVRSCGKIPHKYLEQVWCISGLGPRGVLPALNNLRA